MSAYGELEQVLRNTDVGFLDRQYFPAEPAAIADKILTMHRAEVLREAAAVAGEFPGRYADMDAMKAAGVIGPHTMSTVIRDELRRMAAAVEQGEKDTPTGESTPPAAELTIYRASHDSIVMGHYTTAAAAREHCETLMRREVGEDVLLGWVPDHGGEDAPEELCTGEDVECTGYVVTPLQVASEYDEEADE